MTTLVMPYHDPDGSQREQLEKQIPRLLFIFDNIIVHVSSNTHEETKYLLNEASFWVKESTALKNVIYQIGAIRRELLRMYLESNDDYAMYCDGDRILHWCEHHNKELRNCVNSIHLSDFTVYGRTNRAWLSHPDAQKVTESIIDKMFAVKTGLEWDVLAAARGISKRCAHFIVDCSKDDTFGVDVSWPIMVQDRSDYFSMSYVRIDGLSFEGENRDGDIKEWIHRSKIVQVELESML